MKHALQYPLATPVLVRRRNNWMAATIEDPARLDTEQKKSLEEQRKVCFSSSTPARSSRRQVAGAGRRARRQQLTRLPRLLPSSMRLPLVLVFSSQPC